MRVRLGYVSISKKLGKKVTSSSTVTFANYNKIALPEKKSGGMCTLSHILFQFYIVCSFCKSA